MAPMAFDRKEYNREHYKKNKERILERARNYYENNKERARKYQAENKENIRKYSREYAKAGLAAAALAFNHAKKFNAFPSYYEQEKDKIRKVYEKRAELQRTWNIKLEVDHIIPFEHGGLHEHSNLQILHHSLNNRKQNKLGHFESIKGSRYKFIS